MQFERHTVADKATYDAGEQRLSSKYPNIRIRYIAGANSVNISLVASGSSAHVILGPPGSVNALEFSGESVEGFDIVRCQTAGTATVEVMAWT